MDYLALFLAQPPLLDRAFAPARFSDTYPEAPPKLPNPAVIPQPHAPPEIPLCSASTGFPEFDPLPGTADLERAREWNRYVRANT